MKKNETITSENLEEKMKKSYVTPTLEKIGAVKDATRGATLGDTDSGGQSSSVPSDPHG